jgi:hypothetical protein
MSLASSSNRISFSNKGRISDDCTRSIIKITEELKEFGMTTKAVGKRLHFEN